jgi:AraC family cel operon transcriptional repressor
MKLLHWAQIVAPGEQFHAARYSHGRLMVTLDHTHDFAELFWVCGGEGLHHLNGETFSLCSGSLVWMRPPDHHGIETVSGEPLLISNIAFPRETMDFLGERYFAGQNWAFWQNGNQPMMQRIEAAQIQLLEREADNLARSPRESFYIERFLLNLLYELHPQHAAPWATETPIWLVRACREIENPENFAEGVSALVRLCGYSREHVTRCLRQYRNITPTELINHARMSHAAHQLEMSNRTILDIALSCGIENLSHFYALFRTRYGVTPRAYRLAHRRMF